MKKVKTTRTDQVHSGTITVCCTAGSRGVPQLCVLGLKQLVG